MLPRRSGLRSGTRDTPVRYVEDYEDDDDDDDYEATDEVVAHSPFSTLSTLVASALSFSPQSPLSSSPHSRLSSQAHSPLVVTVLSSAQ
jgi:hypothetical protein